MSDSRETRCIAPHLHRHDQKRPLEPLVGTAIVLSLNNLSQPIDWFGLKIRIDMALFLFCAIYMEQNERARERTNARGRARKAHRLRRVATHTREDKLAAESAHDNVIGAHRVELIARSVTISACASARSARAFAGSDQMPCSPSQFSRS